MRSLATLASLLAASPAFGAAFSINEQGAAATGRGGAYTAAARDASAIYFNPAGIAELEGLNVYVGGDVVLPSAKFSSASGDVVTRADDQTFLLPNAYATYRATSLLAAGIGVSVPFGLGLRWPETSPGRQIVREQELRTTFITPTVGANLSAYLPGLALAGGLDIVPASVYLRRDVLFGSSVADAQLGGTTVGVSGRGGVRYAPPAVPGLTVGLAYRGPVKLVFEGQGNFDAEPTFRSQLPEDGDVSTSITLPDTVLGGVAYAIPGVGLELEVDLDWVGWSRLERQRITLPDGSVSTTERDWHNTLVVRVGAEYDLAGLKLRAGYIHDPTPIPDTTLNFTLPDITRNVLTVGAGYKLPAGVTVDAAVLHVLPGENTTAAGPTPAVKGTYDVSAWLFALSIGWSYDAPDTAPVQVEPVKPSVQSHAAREATAREVLELPAPRTPPEGDASAPRA